MRNLQPCETAAHLLDRAGDFVVHHVCCRGSGYVFFYASSVVGEDVSKIKTARCDESGGDEALLRDFRSSPSVAKYRRCCAEVLDVP